MSDYFLRLINLKNMLFYFFLKEEEKEIKRQAFIDKSLRRKQKIEAANEIRRELAYRSRHLAEQVLIGRLSVKDAGDAFNSLPEPSAFPRSEMTEASKK